MSVQEDEDEYTPLIGRGPGLGYAGAGTRTNLRYLGYIAVPIILSLIILAGLAVAVILTLRDPCPCSVIVEYNGTVANATGGAPIVPTGPFPLTIALLADQGLRGSSRAVLQMVREQNASIVLHAGDFDYQEAPICWQDMIFDELLNETSPLGLLTVNYFAALGNHDIDYGKIIAHSYTRRLRDALHPEAAECCCTGRVGVRATCVWENVVVLQIGKGTTNCFQSGIEGWIADELARLSDYPWKFCMFHKNQRAMQLAEKGDEVGWGVYEACREGGAIVLTGHDHEYARTFLMSSFGPVQTISSTSSELNVTSGESFVIVSGLAGHSIRGAVPALKANPWWAATLSRGDPLANFGALFIRIGDASVGSDPRRGMAFFLTVAGDVIDAFTIRV